MSRIDHRDSLLHRIDSHVVGDVPGDHHVCPLLQGKVNLILSGSRHNGSYHNRRLRIPKVPHMGDAKGLLHIDRTLLQRHVLRELSDAPKSLMGDRVLIGDLQHIGLNETELLRRLRRHGGDIEIRVHGKAGHVVGQEPYDALSDVVRIRHMLYALKEQRMVRQQKVRADADRILNHVRCGIQSDVDGFDVLIRPARLQARIVPALRKGGRAELIQLCNQISQDHSSLLSCDFYTASS